MVSISGATIETHFSNEVGRAEFPVFCNSIISLETPRSRTFPNLSSKSGPDGGIDGHWDLTNTIGDLVSPFTRSGWNVYQFKALDVVALGRPKAFAELCRRCDGAIAAMMNRLEHPTNPALYVIFTNLQLGIDRQSTTVSAAHLNQQTAKLRQALLKGCPEGVEVEIFDAGKIEGLVSRNPVLRQTWFDGIGISWPDAYKRESNIWKVASPLVGREADVKQLEAWLVDDSVRIITLTGLNSIGKTRLALEGTRSFVPVVFVIDDSSHFVRDGLSSLTSNSRPVILLLDDPGPKEVESLARHALGSDKPIKLVLTIPSRREIPATAFGDAARVKSWHIGPLAGEAPRQLLDAVSRDFDNRARDWILQQAGGNPGVIIAAAQFGPDLRRSANTLRERITGSFRQKLKANANEEAVLVASILSPLVYVRLDPPDEIRALCSEIEPSVSESTIRRRLPELEALGYIRRRAATVTVVPPVFAAGLLTELIEGRPDLPTLLFARLDHSARLRLLERLVTLELPSNAPFWHNLLGSVRDLSPIELGERLEILEYLARAAPGVVAQFIERDLDRLLQLADIGDSQLFQRIGDVIAELLEEYDTGPAAFDMLMRVVMREGALNEQRGVSQLFCECFVHWYPRPFSYQQRERALEQLLASTYSSVRLLAVKAITMATAVPGTLSGRAVLARRLGPTPNYGTMGECWAFIRRIMRRRLELCQSIDVEVATNAVKELPQTLATLYHHLPIEDAMELFREVVSLHFDKVVEVDSRELWGQLKWIRDKYAEHATKPEYQQRKAALEQAVVELDGWITRLTTGSFVERLRLAMGQNVEFEEIEFEGRKVYEFELRVIHLAREGAAKPELMSNGAWDELAADRGMNSNTFAREMGRADSSHRLYESFLARADDWRWAQMLASYLDGAREAQGDWADACVSQMPLSRPPSNIALLVTARNALPSPISRERFQALMEQRHVTPFDVAMAFSCGRWLEKLPPDEVRLIFEFIHSDPQQSVNLANVMSLYLHHQKPLPKELIPIARKTLEDVRNISDGGGNNSYHCDQIAIGIARTDLDAGFVLLQSCADRIGQRERWAFSSGWDPFDWPGSRDFWEFMRGHSPERVYDILGGLQRKHRWPDFRQARDRQLLDLEKDQDIIIGIAAKRGLKAAEIFADCAISNQKGFITFATRLLDLYPNEQGIRGSLNSAVIEKTGFGSEFNHLSEADAFVKEHRANGSLSPAGKQWLHALEGVIDARRADARKYFDTEPPFWS